MVEFPWNRQQNEERSREANREQWEKERERFREQYHQLQEQLKENTQTEDDTDSAVLGKFRFSSAPKRQERTEDSVIPGKSYGDSGIEAVHKGVAAREESAASAFGHNAPPTVNVPPVETEPTPAEVKVEPAPELMPETTAEPVQPPVTPTSRPAATTPAVARPRTPKVKKPAEKDPQSQQIGLTIKALMKENGYNNKLLAEKLGYDKGTVGNYLTGERKPSVGFIIDVARLFKVSTDYILGISYYRQEEHSHTTVAAVGLTGAATQKLIDNQSNRNYGLLISYLIERLPEPVVRRLITSLRISRSRMHSANITTEPFSFKLSVDERGNQRYLINTEDAQALLIEHILAQFRRFFTQMANDEELLNQMFRLEDDSDWE